ncbi:ttll6 [Scenedesmus sp. PABB004]|nr:ttll6 [Scenedesmus sp. PABB004]
MERPRGEKRRVPPPPLRVDLSGCSYELLRLVAARLGWQLVGEGDWDLAWTDTSVAPERVLALAPTQRLNHWAGMLTLARKASMARLLQRMADAVPGFGAFLPHSWVLPEQLPAFLAAARAQGSKSCFIVKPDAGCQGRGIRLVTGGSAGRVAAALAGIGAAVAQAYVARPLLIDGRKFDLRLYVLVADVAPLRGRARRGAPAQLFLYREGLARLCATRYEAPAPGNLGTASMHLSNYAVNARADGAPAGGIKWSLAQLRRHLEAQGVCWASVWASVAQVVTQAVIAVTPHLAATAAALTVPAGPPLSRATAAPRCFEILGFDVLLDEALSPWLLEVNHSPSFAIDSPLDRAIKEQLIVDALTLVRVEPAGVAAAKAAARRATRARLLAPSPPRARAAAAGGASSEAGVGGSGGEAGARAAHQAQLDALLAARDRWQARHAGLFQRVFPVLLPHADAQRPGACGSAEGPAAYLVALQAQYDQLLATARQLHELQRRQPAPARPALVKVVSAKASPAKAAPAKAALAKAGPAGLTAGRTAEPARAPTAGCSGVPQPVLGRRSFIGSADGSDDDAAAASTNRQPTGAADAALALLSVALASDDALVAAPRRQASSSQARSTAPGALAAGWLGRCGSARARTGEASAFGAVKAMTGVARAAASAGASSAERRPASAPRLRSCADARGSGGRPVSGAAAPGIAGGRSTGADGPAVRPRCEQCAPPPASCAAASCGAVGAQQSLPVGSAEQPLASAGSQRVIAIAAAAQKASAALAGSGRQAGGGAAAVAGVRRFARLRTFPPPLLAPQLPSVEASQPALRISSVQLQPGSQRRLARASTGGGLLGWRVPAAREG